MKPEIEYPLHIHLHSHGTVEDYDGVKELVEQEDDPFLVILPEIPPDLAPGFQAISDADRIELQKYKINDNVLRDAGYLLEMSSARGHALAEILFDSGLVVVSAHPTWDENSKEANGIVNMRGRLEDTLDQAAETMSQELPKIASVIRSRDDFTADNFFQVVDSRVKQEDDFEGLRRVPCLMEIGSYHFQLIEKLRSKGVEVEASGDTDLANSDLAYDRAVHQMLTSPFGLDIDWEKLAFESLLSNTVYASNSNKKAEAVRRALEGIDRNNWSELYAAEVASRKSVLQIYLPG